MPPLAVAAAQQIPGQVDQGTKKHRTAEPAGDRGNDVRHVYSIPRAAGLVVARSRWERLNPLPQLPQRIIAGSGPPNHTHQSAILHVQQVSPVAFKIGAACR